MFLNNFLSKNSTQVIFKSQNFRLFWRQWKVAFCTLMKPGTEVIDESYYKGFKIQCDLKGKLFSFSCAVCLWQSGDHLRLLSRNFEETKSNT